MIEYRFLIPIVRDDNRQPHCFTLWDCLHNRLAEFGGFTVADCRGVWRDANGKLVDDYSRQYTVACQLSFAEFAAELLPLWGQFGQQCIYLASGDCAELVDCPPRPIRD